MKSQVYPLVMAVVFAALLLTGCGGINIEDSVGMGADKITEQPTTPAEYADKINPLARTPNVVDDGQTLYSANCASCHGNEASGDGPVAGSLEPRPTNLAMRQESLDDAYLYWRIAEGGAMRPFRSSMPPWKSLLTEEQIWKIIVYIRTLEG